MNKEFFEQLSAKLKSEADTKVEYAYKLYLQCDDMYRNIVLHGIGLKDVPTEERIKDCFDTLELLDGLDSVIEDMEYDIRENGPRDSIEDLITSSELKDDVPLYLGSKDILDERLERSKDNVLEKVYWSKDSSTTQLPREAVLELVNKAREKLPLFGEMGNPNNSIDEWTASSVSARHTRVGQILTINVSHAITDIKVTDEQIVFEFVLIQPERFPNMDLSKLKFGYRGFSNFKDNGQQDWSKFRLVTFDLISKE